MVKTTVNNQEYLNKFTHFKEKEESQREKKMGRKRIKTRIKYKKQESNNANKHISENEY